MKIKNFENLFNEYDRSKRRLESLRLALAYKRHDLNYINTPEIGKIHISDRMLRTEIKIVKREYEVIKRKILKLEVSK